MSAWNVCHPKAFPYLRAHWSSRSKREAATKVVINLNPNSPTTASTTSFPILICSMLSHLRIRLSIGRAVVLLSGSLELRSFIWEETGSGRYDLLDAEGLGLPGVSSASDLKSRKPTWPGLVIGPQGRDRLD